MGKHFTQAGVNGTIVVAVDVNGTAIHGGSTASALRPRYAPASLQDSALFSLDAGAVADEFQVFKWDGVKRTFAGHNQDQTLRSAMRYSTLWVYEGFARQIGEPKARAYLRSIDYGNADPATSKGAYWVDGNLRISALEQVAFLRKLSSQCPAVQGGAPAAGERPDGQAGDVGLDPARQDRLGRRYGWWVGWVESNEGAVFFALNIDTPRRTEDLPKREQIVRAVLESMNLLSE